MFELGRQQDMVVFFACIDSLTRSSLSETGRFFLLDRLYKRYPGEEDLDEAVSSMENARKQFKLETVNKIDLVKLGLDKIYTLLSLDEVKLAMLFGRYFDAFLDCVGSYKGGKETFGYYTNGVRL